MQIKKMYVVYYVRGLKYNLLSFGLFLKKVYDIHFFVVACYVSNKNQFIARVEIALNNLFSVDLQNQKLSCFLGIDNGVSKFWSHLSYENIEMLSKKMKVKGWPKINLPNGVYEACLLRKQHRTLFLLNPYGKRKVNHN